MRYNTAYESTTFLSMYLEHNYTPPYSKDQLNPGDQDPALGDHYLDYMREVAEQKPKGSAEAIELEKRIRGMEDWIGGMNYPGDKRDWLAARYQNGEYSTAPSPGNFSLIQRPGTNRSASARLKIEMEFGAASLIARLLSNATAPSRNWCLDIV